MVDAATCACGTFTIGVCTYDGCGVPVCGDCSRKVDGRRLCLSHVPVVVEEQRQAAERAAAEQRAAQQRAVEEQAARDAEPMEMSAKNAFDVLFLRRPTLREVNSAEPIVRNLAPHEFRDMAVARARQHGLVPFEDTLYTGSRRSLVGRVMASARGYRGWRLYGRYGTETYWVVTTDERVIEYSSGGEGYQSWSRRQEVPMTAELQKEILDGRVVAVRGWLSPDYRGKGELGMSGKGGVRAGEW